MVDSIDPNAVVALYDRVQSDDGAEIEGLVFRHRIDVERLKAEDATVRGWIALLPDEFLADKGGGWSFLNLCQDRHGGQWTGLHQTMEQLVVLAMALGRAQYALPRALWSALPGGMPYIAFNAAEVLDA